MSESSAESGKTVVKTALISVSNKDGVCEFAAGLAALGVKLLSTGGTARALREAGLEVVDVSEHTGSPEILDGRVKTLHPRVHGGILARRGDASHREQVAAHDIEYIDLVCVNLYPFAEVTARGCSFAEAIENIDIGGPSMLRSAAKNHADVAVVVDPADYDGVLAELRDGGLSAATRKRLATVAFCATAAYDGMIADYLGSAAARGAEQAVQAGPAGQAGQVDRESRTEQAARAGQAGQAGQAERAGQGSQAARQGEGGSVFGETVHQQWRLVQGLRYGENPHQRAAFYRDPAAAGPSIAKARVIQGKELSYNNIVDADAALQLVSEFDQTVCVAIKHTNPCGVATAGSAAEAFEKARRCDPVSIFGGIVGFNREVNE